MTLRERAAVALGYKKVWVEDRKEPGHWMWSLKGSAPIPAYALPPLDWNTVMQLRDLAVAKDGHGYVSHLYSVVGATGSHSGNRLHQMALATKEQVLTAALAVLDEVK